MFPVKEFWNYRIVSVNGFSFPSRFSGFYFCLSVSLIPSFVIPFLFFTYQLQIEGISNQPFSDFAQR